MTNASGLPVTPADAMNLSNLLASSTRVTKAYRHQRHRDRRAAMMLAA